MKPKFISVFLFIYLSVGLFAGNPDSLVRKHGFFIATYPSSIFTGDISLGVEHTYQRFRQEIAVFYKCYNVRQNYEFDQGSKLIYSLKYNLVRKKNHLLSVDISYLYMKKYYQDKVTPYIYYGSLNDDPQHNPKPYYLTDCKETLWGPGIGISNLSRLYKHFFWGANLALYLTHYKFHYVAKQHVSGPEIEERLSSGSGYYGYFPLKMPYEVNDERSKRLYVNLLIKIAYQF